jgi:hypothetical protein
VNAETIYWSAPEARFLKISEEVHMMDELARLEDAKNAGRLDGIREMAKGLLTA